MIPGIYLEDNRYPLSLPAVRLVHDLHRHHTEKMTKVLADDRSPDPAVKANETKVGCRWGGPPTTAMLAWIG